MPDIKCPNCNYEFPLEEALNDELKEAIEKEKQELRQKMSDHLKKKEEEMQRKELEWKTQQEKREKEIQLQIETNLRKNITADFENQLRMLEQNNKDNEEKLKQARLKEADFFSQRTGIEKQGSRNRNNCTKAITKRQREINGGHP